MNPSHYPSVGLCAQLTKIGFPKTEKLYSTEDNINFIIGESGGIVYPSFMEMLDVMPYLSGYAWISIEKATKDYIVSYRISSGNDARRITTSNLANALAEMILWLHENNHLNFNK